MNRAALISLCTALMLTGCAAQTEKLPKWLTGEAWDLDAVAALPTAEDPYLAALQEGYLRLARDELSEFDWLDTAVFAERAGLAAGGTAVAPIDPSTRSIPDDAAEGLDNAYKEILGYTRSEGPMLRAARQIGDAQVDFDCWVQEAHEGHQRDEIEACRDRYQLLIQLVRDLAGLPDNMAVVLPSDGDIGGIELSQKGKNITLDRAFAAAGTGEKLGDVPVTEKEIREAFAPALAAQPKPPVEFEVAFEFNSTKISDEGFEAVLAAVAEARTRDAAEFLVTGFADAIGDRETNLLISRSRAERVRKALFDELRDEEDLPFGVEAKGEITPPGKERENTRIVLILVR